MKLNDYAAQLCLCGILIFSASALVAGEPGEVVDLTKPPALDAAMDAKIKALIAQLGAPDTVQREDAEKALSAIGVPAGPHLKEAIGSANPEVSARAKRLGARLVTTGVRTKSYADVLPAEAVFFLEFQDAQATLDRLKTTPLGKFWETPGMRKFIQAHRKEMLATEVQVLDAMNALAKLAKGKAVIALANPEAIQPEEIDPPLTYIFENSNLQTAEAQARQLFDGMGDPIKSKRIYKQFTIEEQTNAHTLFAQERVVHALTEKGMDTILDFLVKPPERTLSPLLADLKALRPNADWLLRLSTNGFKNLVDALQLIDDEQVAMLAGAGFVEGSSIESAGTLNTEGADEVTRILVGGGATNKGLLKVMQNIAPAAPVAGKQALDMMPFQAAMVITINADVAKDAAAVTAALTALDKYTGTLVKDPVAPGAETPAEKSTKPDPGISPAAQALGLGGGVTAIEPVRNPPVDPKGKGKEPERTTPHIDRLQRSGIQLVKLLEQAEGPLCIALFPEQVDVTRVTQVNAPNAPPDPDHIPMSAVFAMCVKDSKPLEQSLAQALKGVKLAYKKSEMNGGTLFVDAEEDEDESAAFWVSERYFAYGTSRDVLEIATSAILNAKGNQRISARAEYQKHVAKREAGHVLIDIFADSALFFDMPYKMGQLGFQDVANPWPDYSVAAGLLKDNLIHLSVKPIPGGLQITSQTPTTLLGLIEAIRRPLSEALLLQ